MLRTKTKILTLYTALSLTIACSLFTDIEHEPDLSGAIMAVTPQGPHDDCFPMWLVTTPRDTSLVWIARGTPISEALSGGELQSVEAWTLTIGDSVDVWVHDVLKRKTPPQYYGKRVLVRSRSDSR